MACTYTYDVLNGQFHTTIFLCLIGTTCVYVIQLHVSEHLLNAKSGTTYSKFESQYLNPPS